MFCSLAVVIGFCLYVFVGLGSVFYSVRQVGPVKGCVCVQFMNFNFLSIPQDLI